MRNRAAARTDAPAPMADAKAGPARPGAIDRRAAGAQAESLAMRHLEARGMVVLDRNFRCRGGEIDLVMRDGRTVVFVEVRMRASNRFGGAGESIDARKRGRIVLAARHYLAGRTDTACRFDVVLLGDPRTGHVEWIRDAFGE